MSNSSLEMLKQRWEALEEKSTCDVCNHVHISVRPYLNIRIDMMLGEPVHSGVVKLCDSCHAGVENGKH